MRGVPCSAIQLSLSSVAELLPGGRQLSEGEVNNNITVCLSCVRADQLCSWGGRGGGGGGGATSTLHVMWGECESACCHGNKAAPQSPLRAMEATWVWPCGGVAWHAERDYWSQSISERKERQQQVIASSPPSPGAPHSCGNVASTPADLPVTVIQEFIPA